MVENRNGVERASDENSGVHRTLHGGWGALGEELAERLTEELGARVLSRFRRLSQVDGVVVLARATARLIESGPPARTPPRWGRPRPEPAGPSLDAYVRRTVFCEARRIDLVRFIDELRAEPDEVRQRIERVKRRLHLLTARERSVLRAVFTLDDVADDDEAGKVVLHAAVAHQMRWNTAHQHVSRAWRKLCDRGTEGWDVDWRAVHRFVHEPPSVELWTAARSYLDACSGRGAHGGPAFVEWTEAHEAHNACFNDWKKHGHMAQIAWRALVDALDRSQVAPRHVVDPLVAQCADLGLDRWVVPSKLAQQSWRALLADVPRPSPETREAWRAFVWAHGFGADAEIAFSTLTAEVARADAAGVDLARAYHRLLIAAERRSSEGVHAKERLRGLLDATRWA